MPGRGLVLIIDDDAKVLGNLEQLLRFHEYSVKTFSSSTSIVECDFSKSPSCAILDVRMWRLDGAELQSWLARARPGLPFILITAYGDISEAVRAIKSGAVDFLTKPIEERRLLRAVERALAQDQQLRLEREIRALPEKQFASLTPREKEVCALVVDGKLNKQIAADLGTCEKTVKVHRGRVMKKMKVDSLAQLVKVIMMIGRGATVSRSGVASSVAEFPDARTPVKLPPAAFS